MQLAVSCSMATLSWMYCTWRPGPPGNPADVKTIVAFGGNLTIFNSLNYVVRNLDNVLIGRRWGASELGFYSRAYQLMLMPLSQIVGPVGAVAIPALSQLQNDPERFREYYLKGLRMIAYLSMPLMTVMAVLSDEVIVFVLGPRWQSAARIFRILAMAAVFQPIVSSSGWIMTALNRARTMAIWGAIATPVMVIAFLIGLPWGGVGVACGYTLADWILSGPALYIALRNSPISLTDVFQVILTPFLLCIVLAAVVALLSRSLTGTSPWIVLCAAPVVCTLTILTARAMSSKLNRDLAVLMEGVRSLWQNPNKNSGLTT